MGIFTYALLSFGGKTIIIINFSISNTKMFNTVVLLQNNSLLLLLLLLLLLYRVRFQQIIQVL